MSVLVVSEVFFLILCALVNCERNMQGIGKGRTEACFASVVMAGKGTPRELLSANAS